MRAHRDAMLSSGLAVVVDAVGASGVVADAFRIDGTVTGVNDNLLELPNLEKPECPEYTLSESAQLPRSSAACVLADAMGLPR